MRRQREDWQRDATRYLATGRTGHALAAYRSHGMMHEAQTREQARSDLIDGWNRDRQVSPDQSRIILTHTNDEARLLNVAARERMRTAGDLGDEVRVTVGAASETSPAGIASAFLQNERGLGVKNGTLGTVEQVSAQSMTVRTDDGRSVRFDLKGYNKIDHGYAATIHKAQGMTVDRTHVLATPGMDAHASYAALSRTATARSYIMAVTILLIRTGLSATCRATCAKIWHRTTNARYPAQSFAERRDHLRGRGRDRAQGSYRRRYAQHVRRPAAVSPKPCLARTVGRGRKRKGAVRQPSGVKPECQKGRWRRTRRPRYGRSAPRHSSAMPALWMRSSRRRRWAARQVPSR